MLLCNCKEWNKYRDILPAVITIQKYTIWNNYTLIKYCPWCGKELGILYVSGYNSSTVTF